MAIDWGPSREVLWWFETDYVVKISTFGQTLAGLWLGKAAWLKARGMEAEGGYRGCKVVKSVASSSFCCS